MFSYLRSNNRRSALPPASAPDVASTRYLHSLHGSTEDFASKHTYRTLEQPHPSPISPDPPILPPIPRVASQHESNGSRDGETQTTRGRFSPFDEESRKEGGIQAPQFCTHAERPSIIKFEDSTPHSTSSGNAWMSPPPITLLQNSQPQNRQLRPPYLNSESLRSYSEPLSKHTRAGTQEKPQAAAKVTRAPPPPPLKLSSTPGPSAAPGRQGKTRFSLRNPMSLLARRRSHEAVAEANNEKAQYKGAYPPVPSLPEDFDPRIRGKVVHDFSAPRPGTNKSSNSVRDSDRFQREAILYNSRKASPNPSTAFVDDDSPSSGEREHTPQFREHFDDDSGPVKDGPAKKRTSAFMYQVSLSESQPNPDPSVLPPFARHLPSNIVASAPTIPKASTLPPKNSLEVVSETSSTDAMTTDKSLPSTPPTSPPVKPRPRASSNTDLPFQPAGLPKHFKSNASRFSFDLAGKGSAAQEKLLEEKHRENERKKARRSNDCQPPEADMADNDDEYSDGFDDLDDDDGLEEKIPGVNADADEPSILDVQQPMQDVDFISPNKSSFTSAPSLASTEITSPDTPRDSIIQPVNLSTSQTSPGLAHPQKANHGRFMTTLKPGMNVSEVSSPESDNDDDLYFDDGMIEDLDVQEEHAFDESVFDDDNNRVYGLPLRDQKFSQMTTNGSLADDPQQSKFFLQEQEKTLLQTDLIARSSINDRGGMVDLAAYQDALAVKVNQAALKGEFARRPSLGPTTEGISDNNAGLSHINVPWNGSGDRQAGGLLIVGGIRDGDDFDVDDALADDSIIAAANAEALENDDEGFYGQEFGFFARASGAGEAEYSNGGYFGSRGLEGIGRSHSGRVIEPSLTPITERSEWSNRNSAISLAMFNFQPASAGPLPSPGLAQLADLMPLEGDDMSLSALMKLRRGAWGGSNASLHSSSSGSPLTYVPSVGFPAAIPMQQSNSSNSSNSNINIANGSPLIMDSGQNFASSYSLTSSNGLNSSNDSSPARITTTLSPPQQAFPAQQQPQSAPAFLPQQQRFVPVLSPPYVNMSQQPKRRSLSPVKRSSMGPPPKPSKGHSRNSSNASESVSYIHEVGGEDGGPGHWVLEKRRVDESGVVEVLGREIVEGGRI